MALLLLLWQEEDSAVRRGLLHGLFFNWAILQLSYSNGILFLIRDA